MDWFVKAFLKASLAWLAAGTSVGVAMALSPALIGWRPVHLHTLLLGFVAMMIFGVAYHVIPRFTGMPLRHQRLAGVHVGLANGGLLLLAGGFALRAHAVSWAGTLLAIGGVLSALGAYLFAFNIWRTIDSATNRDRERAARAADVPSTRAPMQIVTS
ncbi:MAG: cbb3-type cytochrome c oxidase subunit I [Gemmatimonadaceae bacterium]|jgi:cbb3-type cytochrome oxidase subunit 1|nr:cbb3-type cytochrome c oxidase subunit I [Gemmatimonadaceae bacterium]